MELTGKTLQVVEGPGAGQSARIVDYDPETKAYYLSLDGVPYGMTYEFDSWAEILRFDSRYDILAFMSEMAPDYNIDQLTEAPVVDSWQVVLTKSPAA